MAEKYYITNGNKVIGAINNKAYAPVEGSVKLAKRFKYQEANNFLKQNLAGDIAWGTQKFFSAKSGKNYVITNAMNFAGDKGTITNDFSKAKAFRSVADAEAYKKNHRELVKSFGESNCFVVNENLESQELSASKSFTQEQLELLGVKRSSPRVVLSKPKRQSIYDKAQHYCTIWGKPLRYEEMSVDHIVPLSRGGKNEMDNLRCTCEECNRLKGDRMDSEMYLGLANICGREAVKDPDNGAWNLIIRGKVRGIIEKYYNATNKGTVL